MGKSKSRSKPRSKRPELCGVYKGQQLFRHNKPEECRQQLEDAFCKKCPTLPPGEIGMLLVLPADARGPVRIQTHKLTMENAAAAVEALNESLLLNRSKRLHAWVQKVRRQQRSSSSRKHKDKRSSE